MIKLEEIYDAVDQLSKDHIMKVLKSLIRVKTIVPPADNYREYVDMISLFFKDLEYTLEEVIQPQELVDQIPYPLEGPRINLVAEKDNGQKEWISFYGHMDVVPAPDEGNKKWRFDPFTATMIRSGKIYGRGVADMKGSMGCLILALELINKMNLQPKYNISIINCTDEEIGLYPGVRYLAEEGYVKGTIYCMEGVIDPILVVGCAGDLDVEVEVIGRSCHSGMNFLGINALEESIPILVELMKLKKEVEKRESADIPGLPQFGTGKQRNMTPMFNLDIIRAGEKSNIVPGKCTLTINRRLIPDENINDVKKEIENAIKLGKERSKALEVNITHKYQYPAVRMDTNAPGVQKMKEVIKLVQDIPDEKIRSIGMAGSTDMGFISEILGTQDIIFHGCSNLGSNAHGVNETIKLKDIRTFIKELIVFLCYDV
ncbi:MAG: ArgE/DapE family deacylase [Candidatus Lokiarchaeota archaeon]|nr:ArgE/DapE family deacylase [Candidatus Lokiarchaeota archaeon]MBD3199850.1 ArgE/DapE family deacylase [Candidatus Lokiarchaeota archaeon]